MFQVTKAQKHEIWENRKLIILVDYLSLGFSKICSQKLKHDLINDFNFKFLFEFFSMEKRYVFFSFCFFRPHKIYFPEKRKNNDIF